MTIMELKDKRETAQKAADALSKEIPEAIQAILKLAKGHEKIDEIRTALNTVAIYSNRAVAALQDYTWLLDGIMRNTELEWPPTCGTKKK